jgi:hypothetical protein
MTDEVVYQIGLGFELSDGTFLEERVVLSGVNMESFFAEADVFGRHATFAGRRYLGFTGHLATLAEAEEQAGDRHQLTSVEVVEQSPELDAEALADFLGEWDLDAVPQVREYEEIDALNPSFEDVEWWNVQAAFGPATSLAIDLKRCCVRDPNFAGAAAFAVLDAINHQGSLYPVAPVALPYLVDLVVDPEITCRRVLATGLHHIAQAVAEVPERGKIAEMFERIGTEILALSPMGRAEMVDALRRHVDSARAVRSAWPEQAERLTAIADDPAVGTGVQNALDVLAK